MLCWFIELVRGAIREYQGLHQGFKSNKTVRTWLSLFYYTTWVKTEDFDYELW